MNRIQLRASTKPSTGSISQAVDESTRTDIPATQWWPAGDPLAVAAAQEHFSLASVSQYVPLHYEPNYRYPLIVWLHDNGAAESDVVDRVAAMSLRNYVAVGPSGAEQCVSGGWGWIQTAAVIEASEQQVFAAIDQAREQFNIHSQRIFLAGAGHGGTMALRLAFRNPSFFAGVVSINGPLPDGLAPLSRLKRCRTLPLFWTQCLAHHLFDDATLSAQLKLLYTAGFDLTLRQYSDAEIRWDLVLPELNRWLMQHVTQAPVA